MPRLRSEQIQNLTLTNAQIGDGYTYDANGVQIAGFDPTRLIDQQKIKDLEFQPNGWISRGIVNKVDVLPEWTADLEGRLFYIDSTDQLYLGIGTEPWFILISGDQASGWDAELTTRMGSDGTNWNGTMATQFQTLSYTFAADGSDLFVYVNGSLQRLDHDFEIVDERTIRTLRNLNANDVVTMLVILSNSMLNYATKAWVFEKIQAGGINHSLDAAYDDGAVVSVDSRDVDWRLAQDTKFIVSEAISGIALPATHLGTKDITSGHNWQTRWQTFDVVLTNAGTVTGPKTVTLNNPTVTLAEVATEISEALVTAGISNLYGFGDTGFAGLQSTVVGNDISFTLASGSNALPIFGLAPQVVLGDDAYSSYHEFGLDVDASSDAGLEAGEKFWFSVNGTEYFITTGANATYDQVRSSIDTVLDISGFAASTEGVSPNQDIRVTTDLVGLANPTVLADINYAGQIEITQVTTVADVNRSLDGKYFAINSIDANLFGHEKPYYVWYHIDAEQEVSTITTTAEDSNVTLAGSYFDLHSPTTDYFVWFEVETPVSAGYQELGLSALNAGTTTGLTENTTYYFKVAVDGQAQQEFNITTAPDIQPVAEITDVTFPADVAQTYSGRYWELNSQTGSGYYVWYNIDTAAGSEVTDVTTVADTAQSLSGLQFDIHTPSQQYYAWLSMMTDPGLPELAETTDITTVADVAQSLSGSTFYINSADGSPYYVWYEMITDPGAAAVGEISEIVTVADSGQSLSGKYFEVSTISTDYYGWYRMLVAGPVVGQEEITEITTVSDAAKSLSGTYWTFNTPYNEYYVWNRMELTAAEPATAEESTATFNSNVVGDYAGQYITIHNFTTAYDIWFDTTGSDTAPAGAISNPIVADISGAADATAIALIVVNAVKAATTMFSTSSSTGATITFVEDNAGAQNNSADGSNAADVDVATSVTGADYVVATYSTDPAPASKTGVQINVAENDANTVIASAINTQINLLGDVSSSVLGAVITITNDDIGAVADAVDVDSGFSTNVTQQGISSAPATYSTDPAVVGKTGIQINIAEDDSADAVASATQTVLDGMAQFDAGVVNNTVTITATTSGATADATAGNSGFAVSTTQQGSDYIAPTYSTDPAPASKTGIKVVIAEDDIAADVAEATRTAIDLLGSFSATRSNSTITIIDATTGPVTDAVDIDTGFAISVTQQGQDYIAPTYTTEPAGTGIGIKVDIVENDTNIAVAQAVEAAFNGTVGFSATRTNETVTITNDVGGVATNAAASNSGFTINIVEQGYEAYSSTDPAIIGRTSLQVNIIENDTADAIAAKTSTVINASAHFSSSASNDTVTIIDANGGAVTDAVNVDIPAGFSVNVSTPGVDFISADVSWGQILTLLNVSTTSAATWAFNNGDIRLTSDTIGSWTAISLAAGTTGNDFFSSVNDFVSFDAEIPGVSSYSAQPAGVGTPIKVPVLVGANAVNVASSIQTAVDTEGDFNAAVGVNVGVDDHIITVTNVATGFVTDIADHGTAFGLTVFNQGANESTDPVGIGTGIQVDINKDDSATDVATKTQAAVDSDGEFYVTRLDAVLSVQNDFSGAVTLAADVDSGFAFTRTGLGEDVKYGIFSANGLNITLPAAVDGIDAVPASIAVGTADLSGGYNFYTFPKDFAVVISGEPLVEVFLDEAAYNASEVVSKANTKIADAGITNLEAYQEAGHIGFRTLLTGLAQSLDLRDSLSDALVTLGWTAGIYSGTLGPADSIFQVDALASGNEIRFDADVLPLATGTNNIGSEDYKVKEIWAQDAHFDAGTIYIGNAKISEETNEFAFTVDDGVNEWDHFGNTNSAIAPVGADRIGVAGVVGVIPEISGGSAAPGDPGTLQEMLTGFAKSAGGVKVFPDMGTTTGTYGDPTNLKGFLLEKAAGLYLKVGEIVYIKDINRSVMVLLQGTGVVEDFDWTYLEGAVHAVGGESIKYDLTALDANGAPTTGTLPVDSFYVKTTGGIKLEVGENGEAVSITDNNVSGIALLGPGTSGSKIDNFEKVYNAVWNDIADFIEVEAGIELEFGKVYTRKADGTHGISSTYMEKGILGLASDTYGFGVGKKDNAVGTQIPVAIGGIVLAHVKEEYEPGTALTCGPNGILMEFKLEDKRNFPERIIATYYKPEVSEEWNGITVDGRHWVKIK